MQAGDPPEIEIGPGHEVESQHQRPQTADHPQKPPASRLPVQPDESGNRDAGHHPQQQHPAQRFAILGRRLRAHRRHVEDGITSGSRRADGEHQVRPPVALAVQTSRCTAPRVRQMPAVSDQMKVIQLMNHLSLSGGPLEYDSVGTGLTLTATAAPRRPATGSAADGSGTEWTDRQVGQPRFDRSGPHGRPPAGRSAACGTPEWAHLRRRTAWSAGCTAPLLTRPSVFARRNDSRPAVACRSRTSRP